MDVRHVSRQVLDVLHDLHADHHVEGLVGEIRPHPPEHGAIPLRIAPVATAEPPPGNLTEIAEEQLRMREEALPSRSSPITKADSSAACSGGMLCMSAVVFPKRSGISPAILPSVPASTGNAAPVVMEKAHPSGVIMRPARTRPLTAVLLSATSMMKPLSPLSRS